MFESESSEDRQSKKTTRRMFLGSGIAVAAGVAYLSLRRMPDVEASGAGRGTPGMVTIVNFSDDGKNLGKETVPKIVKSNAEWKAQLPGNSYDIARLADTEMAFTGSTWNEHSPGIFRCICCDTALFDAKTKFESGTGWPSFWAPIAKENVAEAQDTSFGMTRTEAKCKRCDAHLGHIFDDGPNPTGLRYCMNSASMKFIKAA
jgi:peptide-methionine (R)-S-oxide reductase